MARRAWGTVVVLRALARERGVAYRSSGRVRASRDNRVRELARYVATSVPHYRDLFRRLGIDPREICTADHLARIPPLDRPEIQAEPDRFRSESRLGRTAVEFRTTGSTGQPITVFHDRRSLLRNLAFSERERAVEATLVGRGRGYTVLQIGHAAATEQRVQEFYAQAAYRPFRPNRHRASVEDGVGSVISMLHQVRPDVVRTYGSYLELLFRTIAGRSLSVPLPRVVVYAGDTLSRTGRRLIEDEFGVPVLSAYNAVEAFKIGFLCEARSGFHLHEDLCHVTIAGPDGAAVAPGELGEIVISNLVNHGTVLLNYRLGDLARLQTAMCRCGRSSPRLVDLEGRVDELIALGSGALVHPGALWAIIAPRTEVIRYQLIQHETARFELRLVTTDRAAYDRIATPLSSEIAVLLEFAHVETTHCSTLEGGARGKFRPVVPLVQQSKADVSVA